MTNLKPTARRIAVLRAAAEGPENVLRYRSDRAAQGFRYSVLALEGDHHRPVGDLLEAKLLKLGPRLGPSMYNPTSIQITETGLAVLAAWTAS